METDRATILVRISLGVNIAVLIVVCTVLIAFSDAEPVTYGWGPATAARGILLSVYFSILAVSILLLGLYVYRSADRAAIDNMIAALLLTQILYKITTPITAGPANPVAISNLGISVLHSITLYLLWKRYKSSRAPRSGSRSSRQTG